MKEQTLIPDLFRTEYRKIISVLCKLFGIVHIEIAEDITNDTFLLASEIWELKGIPENPTAWLYTVAKNKTKDYFKRNKIFTDKVALEIKYTQDVYEEIEIDLSDQNIKDSQLQMIFAICNPIIANEAQIGLALRILCGFGIEEIAEAFLTNKETINKRLYRAKEKLRNEKIKIEFPSENEIENRLEAVISTLYLLFNEGYHSTTQNTSLRKEFCFEAMRMNYLLIENPKTNTSSVNALMSLMCFHSSRFDARINHLGEAILYEDQNKDLWNEELIEKGNFFLIESTKGQVISKYYLEACIAYWHASKIENPNKWEHILQLYNQLLQIEYSPITALNRTYVILKTQGKEIAIKELEKINLVENHFYHALLGSFYTHLDTKKALEQYRLAFAFAKTKNDKQHIEKHINRLIK